MPAAALGQPPALSPMADRAPTWPPHPVLELNGRRLRRRRHGTARTSSSDRPAWGGHRSLARVKERRQPRKGDGVKPPGAVRMRGVRGMAPGGGRRPLGREPRPGSLGSRSRPFFVSGALRKNERIDAAAFAAARIAAVRDEPAGRLALARSIYEEPTGRRSQRPRFRRAALAFTRWMVERGVLNPLDGERPGSRWWRAMNERLLRDSCEAFGRATGRGGSPSTATVDHWAAFIDQPTAQSLVPRAQREHRRCLPRPPRPRGGREPNRALLPQRRARAPPVRTRARRRASARTRPHRPRAAPLSATHAAARSTSSSPWDVSSPTITPPTASSRTTSRSSTSSVACSTMR